MNRSSIKLAFVEASQSFGGSQISTFDLVNHLSMLEKDIEILYVAQAETPSYEQATSRNISARICDLGSKGFPGIKNIGWIISYTLKAWRLIRNERIDLVHATNETLLWWLLPCWLSGAIPIWNVRAELDCGLKSRIRKAIYLTFCNKVICVSDAVYRSVFGDKAPSKIDVKVIRNFVPAVLNKQVKSHGKKTFSSRPISIGFVGRLDDPVKDVDKALSIILSLLDKCPSNVTFEFWGDVSSQKKDLLLAAIPAEMKNRIFFSGQTDDYNQIYQGLDILLLTSKNEGSPRVIMEAAMHGIPTVGHCVGGVPELIKNEETGFLFRDNKEAVNKLSYLINDTDELLRVSNNAKKHFTENFNWREKSLQYVSFYTDSLNR